MVSGKFNVCGSSATVVLVPAVVVTAVDVLVIAINEVLVVTV